MRIWDLDPGYLCRQHLLAEHRELHGLWNILTLHEGKGGYSKHPETKRWVGKLAALYLRHEKLENEMNTRNYRHKSPLEKELAVGESKQKVFINSIQEQKEILLRKNCECQLK